MEKAFLLLLLNLSLSFLSVTCYDPSSHLLIRFPPTHPPTPHHHHEHHQHHHQHHYPHHHAHPPQPHRHPPHHPQPAVPPTKQPPPAKPPTHPPVRTPYPPHHPPPAVPPTKSPPPVKSPAHPPVKTPTHPPLKPPTHPRAPPTAHPPTRKLVAVQGVVFCKSCNYTGINTLTGASPLPGARVMLKCKDTIFTLKQTAKTDKNGYFFLQAPPQITTYGAHKCKVYLASPPSNSPCQTPTNLHDGVSGAVLVPEKVEQPQPLPFSLYTVGPFAYEPPKCPKH